MACECTASSWPLGTQCTAVRAVRERLLRVAVQLSCVALQSAQLCGCAIAILCAKLHPRLRPVPLLYCACSACSYFEANGHGTVLFHPSLLERLRDMEDSSTLSVRLGAPLPMCARGMPDSALPPPLRLRRVLEENPVFSGSCKSRDGAPATAHPCTK